MLDRVLDERLHEERRHPHRTRVGRHVDRDDELVAESRLLEVEIALHVSQLLLERHELRGARELRAHVVGKREHEASGAVGVGAHERGDRVERVEHEVRLHLRLERGRRRTGELRELQLRRELVAEALEQVDRRLVERRSCGRVDDHGACRPVRVSERHDRRGAERAGSVTAFDADP